MIASDCISNNANQSTINSDCQNETIAVIVGMLATIIIHPTVLTLAGGHTNTALACTYTKLTLAPTRTDTRKEREKKRTIP